MVEAGPFAVKGTFPILIFETFTFLCHCDVVKEGLLSVWYMVYGVWCMVYGVWMSECARKSGSLRRCMKIQHKSIKFQIRQSINKVT